MHKLFEGDRKTFLKYLNPESGIVKRGLGGIWTLEIVHKNNEAGNLIDRGMYIEAPTPKGNQKFKVRMIESINETEKRITAFHRFYDLKNNYIEDTNIVDKTRKEALEQILNKTLEPHDFKVISHTGYKLSNLRIVGLSPFKAIMGDSNNNTVLKRYGGEIDFDNDTIIIEDIIGKDDGYLVTWNKNMVELNEKLDDTGLITRIVPIGNNRLKLPELYVDSSYINAYEDIFTEEVSFDIGPDEDEGITEEYAIELLRQAAKNYFFDSGCDIINTSYSISIKDIKNKPKYEACSFFYNLDIGDTVTVLKNNGLRIKNRLLYYEYDSVNEEFLNQTLNSTTSKVTTSINSATNVLTPSGNVNTSKLEGYINLLKISMGAMVEGAEKHSAKAILFEDRVANSPTYGAMAIGTKGFMISGEFNVDKNDWNWRTFGTGQGFNADLIVSGTILANLIKAGIIRGHNDNVIINLDTGTIHFKKGNLIGNNLRINLDTGEIVSGDVSDKDSKRLTIRDGEILNSKSLIIYANETMQILNKLSAGIQAIYNSQTIVRGSNGVTLDAGLGNVVSDSNFYVLGSKNCIQSTRDFGDVLFYCTEGTKSDFTDRADSIFTVSQISNENGRYERLILIDNIFKQSANLKEYHYDVAIYKYGFGDYRFKEKNEHYFILESDNKDFTFGYEIKALRRGYEDDLLKDVTQEVMKIKSNR